MTGVLEAAFAGDLTEEEIKRALIASGEMKRWNRDSLTMESPNISRKPSGL